MVPLTKLGRVVPALVGAMLPAALIAAGGCGVESTRTATTDRAADSTDDAAPAAGPPVTLGIDVLGETDFAALRGKRVGFVGHAASVNGELRSSVDVLLEGQAVGGYRLVKLFGPEHGIHGDVYAGDAVADRTDPRSGLPLMSLYGSTRKPTEAMLADLDVMVVDLQDIGARSYTYISTMAGVVDACLRLGRDVVILDRPNPMGGRRIEGGMVEPGYESFVSDLPVPYLHGMTMGELAMLTADRTLRAMAAEAGRPVPPTDRPLLSDRLTVVKMAGWRRSMVWSDTGLRWAPTSPHIPTEASAYAYAMTGVLGELGAVNIGVGYTLPFELVGAPSITDAFAFAEALNRHPLKPGGVLFRPIYYKPFYAAHRGKVCGGVQIVIDPQTASSLYEVNFVVLDVLGAPAVLAGATDRHAMFNKVTGSDRALRTLSSGAGPADLFAAWRDQSAAFAEARQPFLLYD